MKHRWLFLGLAAAAALPLSMLAWLGTGGRMTGEEPGAHPASPAEHRPAAQLARESASAPARVNPGSSKLLGRLIDERTGAPFAGATVVLERRAGAPESAPFLTRLEPIGTLTPAFPLRRRAGLGSVRTFRLQYHAQLAEPTTPAAAAEAGSDGQEPAPVRLSLHLAGAFAEQAVGQSPAQDVVQLGGETLSVTPPADGTGADSGVGPPGAEGAGATATGSGSASGSGAVAATAAPSAEEQASAGTPPAEPPPARASTLLAAIAQRAYPAAALDVEARVDTQPLLYQFEGNVEDRALQEVLGIMHGRMEAARGAGFQVPGFVELGLASGPGITFELARAVTDEEGRFELDCPETDDCVLRVLEETPYRFEPASRPVGRVAFACGSEFDWEALRVRHEPFEGRVVDARTRAPVPFLALRIRGADGRAEPCETDEEGRFRTPRAFRAGSLELEFLDAEDVPVEGVKRSIEFLAEATEPAPAELAVRIGPTLRFAPRLGSTAEAAGLLVRVVGVRWKGSKQPVESAWHPIRMQGGGYWMRFPAAVTYDEGARVELVTADGLLAGFDAFAGEPESDVNPRAIRFALRASCQGVVAGAESAPQAGARVRILDADGNELAAATSGEDGSFKFLGLDARRARTIEVSHADFGTSREPIHLGAGRLEQLAPALPGCRPPPADPGHRVW